MRSPEPLHVHVNKKGYQMVFTKYMKDCITCYEKNVSKWFHKVDIHMVQWLKYSSTLHVQDGF